ncbi:MAG: diguanylate cyclase [Lachnospiraceae bacterium]|nr:diguanylate cyclase [Lachnospiraceae bacterium]
MKTETSKLIKALVLVYVVILALFAARIFFQTDLTGFINAEKDAVSHDYSKDWILDSGEHIDLKDISAGEFGGSYSATKFLPGDMLETDAIYMSTSNIRFNVYVNDSLIYSYDTVENMTGTGDGVSYHMIGLGTKDEGDVIRLDISTVFENSRGGRINEMWFGPEEQFRYYMLSHNFAGRTLSELMIVFGVTVLIFFLIVVRKSQLLRSLWGLGLSAILFGIWSLADTGVPQLVSGTVYACREIVYGLPHLAEFPMIYFVTYVTRVKRKIYLYLSFALSVLCFGTLIFARYVFGIDLHTMTVLVYFSYVSGLLMLIVLLVDNEIYCRKRKLSSNLRYFYIGAAIFVATSLIDIIRYTIGTKMSIGRGSWFRFGLVLFFIFMALQIFMWWNSEKTSLERDRFINRLLQYVTDMDDPESRLNKVLQYLCTELKADRAYIFEEMPDGTFDNTYEYCAEGVTPEIDNLKGLPYEGVIDTWYDEYEKGGHVLIYDLEKYRSVSEKMYDILKPQGIRTLVTGPIELDGKRIGFFGVDNPPAEMMKEISEIMRLLMYFMSEMILQRNNRRELVDYSFHDSLTGVGNRRAITRFETESLDTSRSYGFLMCDINGLKAVNDNQGHAAGDEMIKTVASCMTNVFGSENVYRMGGDEFAIYTYADSKAAFEEKVAMLNKMISEKDIHMAIGSSFAEGGDPDYAARRLEADNRMYEEKRAFYSDGNDRRGVRMKEK